jgi:septum formation topological specificity factor MinE
MQLRLKEQTQTMKERDVTAVQRPELLHVLRREILHIKVKWVKLYGTPIVSGKTMNRQKILNNISSNKYIINVKWTGKS